ncbi:hypothetical protein DCC79_10475 [bacterium]|nr:Crp/Fnr family transcriptional regulator [Chloroflexi bacterium CFX6]RIL09632.1 MAG: hypothetical protein DCC79_10475 [bacterium]
MQTDIDALQRNKFFQDLSSEHLARLAMHVQHRHFNAGDVIFEEGDPGNAVFLIGDGEVKIAVKSPTDRDITLALLGPGDAFGELSLLDNSPRSATATATAPTTLLVVHRRDFMSLVESDMTALRGLLSALSRIIRNMNQRLADIAMLDVHGRMAKALFELAARHGQKTDDGLVIDRDVTIDDLAGLVGMYPVQVERLMRDYQYEYLLKYENRRITILREDAFRTALGEGRG